MIDRRRFLHASGAAAVVGATGLPSGCGDNLPVPTGAVFDVDTMHALVWIGGRPGAMTEVVAFDDAGVEVASGTTALAESGTGAVELSGLVPGIRHTVRIHSAGVPAEPFWFVTAPPDDDPRPVRIAWSADVDLDPAFVSPILPTLGSLSADVFVSLGDWPYTDNAPGAVTLDEYRERHWLSRDDAATQALLRSVSVRAIYDDHEVRNDWDAGSWAIEPQRHVDALAAWDEFFPVRAALPGTRFRRWRWGAHVECFLLDCRRHRTDKHAPDDASKTMLGAAQLAWLLDGVTTSTARFKLIFTTVPLDFGNSIEHWNGYLTERTRIFDAIVAAGVTGVLFLSADMHWFASHRHAHGFRELQAGPLARGVPTPPPLAPGVLARVVAYNVGVLDIDGSVIRARCVDASGVARYEEVFTVAELTPSP